MQKTENNFTVGDTFGSRLRNIRTNRGLSQIEFAQKIGYKQGGSISNIENDKTPPDIPTLAKIAQVLNVDLHWLITGRISPAKIETVDLLELPALCHLSDILDKIKQLKKEQKTLEVLANAGDKRAVERVEEISQRIALLYCEHESDSEKILEAVKGIRRYVSREELASKKPSVANSVPETPKNNSTTAAALK